MSFVSAARLQSLPRKSKVLVAVTDRVGDALFRTPAIRILARTYPHIRFDALTFGKGAQTILCQHPDVGCVHMHTHKRAIAELAKNYDLVINTRSSNVRRYLSKVQTPIIQHRRIARQSHKAEDLLCFIQTLLPRHSALSPSDRTYVLPVDTGIHNRLKQRLEGQYSLNSQEHKLIGLHLGCASIRKYKLFFSRQALVNHKKTWPVQRYIRLAQRLVNEDPARRIVIIGSPEENFLCQHLVDQVPQAVDTCPDLSLLEMTALIDRCELLICNDSGPMHLACARQKPVLALFGPTIPQKTGPFPALPQFQTIKRDTMHQIEAEEVWAKAETLLEERSRDGFADTGTQGGTYPQSTFPA